MLTSGGKRKQEVTQKFLHSCHQNLERHFRWRGKSFSHLQELKTGSTRTSRSVHDRISSVPSAKPTLCFCFKNLISHHTALYCASKQTPVILKLKKFKTYSIIKWRKIIFIVVPCTLMLSNFYLPTDVQKNCFKRILKFTLKQLLNVSVQSPSSRSVLFELAKVIVIKIIS